MESLPCYLRSADAMENRVGREALRGVEEKVLDLFAEALTSAQWAKVLRAPLELAVSRGDRRLAQNLVGAGAAIGDSLHEAFRRGHKEMVNGLLENGESVGAKNAKNAYGRTLLHTAAINGNLEMVQFLLLKGADMDTSDDDKRTPLFTAVECGAMPVVRALLTSGADINVRCSDQEMTVVHMAVRKALSDILRTVTEYGADLDASDVDGCTALHIAARGNNVDAIKVLVEAGANVRAKNSHGDTVLHSAVDDNTRMCLQAVTALLTHRAVVNSVNSMNNAKHTALHYAACNAGTPGTAEMVDLLLRSGADETILDENGAKAEGIIGNLVEGLGFQPLTDDVERVRNLLANAPADRAWRRRGYLVLCRVRPDRVQRRQDINNPRAAVGYRTRDNSKLARAGDSSGDESGCGGTVEARTGGNWAGVVARVLELREEGIFRKIVGYL